MNIYKVLLATPLLILSLTTTAFAAVVPYETEILIKEGNATIDAFSTANIAEVEVFATGDIDGYGQAAGYASSESTLQVRGGGIDAVVLIDITYTMEVTTYKDPNSGGELFRETTASANTIVDIADVLDDESSIWEAELDLFTTGVLTGEEDDADNITVTVGLLSGHDYIVALEAFAEVRVVGAGFARAEAFVDPVFSINTSQAGFENFSVLQIAPPGSSTVSSVVPVPAAVWLFGSSLAGLGWMRRKQTV